MNPSMGTKKPLFARKTMTPGNRKQLEMLNKLKSLRGLNKAVDCVTGEDNHSCLKLVETSCLKNGSAEDLDSTLLPLEQPVTKLVVSSEISVYNDQQAASKPLAGHPCNTDSDVSQFLNAGALQDMLYHWYETESSSPLFKPVEVHLNVVPDGQSKETMSTATSPTSKILVLDPGKEIPEELLGGQSTVPVLKRGGVSVQLHEKTADSSVLPDARGKRRHSESNRDVHCKLLRTSGGTGNGCDVTAEKRQIGCEKVKSFIQSQLDASLGDLNTNLQRLNERIDHTHCLRKHEGIAIAIVKKISKLDRRINSAVALRKTKESKNAHLPGMHFPNTILNQSKHVPRSVNGQSALSTKRPSTHRKSRSPVAESSREVICLDVESKSPDMQVVDGEDVWQKGTSVNADTSAKAPCNTKNVLLIDITEEGSNENKEGERRVSGKTTSAPENLKLDAPQPVTQSSTQAPAQFCHLPPLPRIHLHPEQEHGLGGSLPPQKLDLAVAQVKNPKGIALKWHIGKVDPRCAPIESFHLFFCVEGEGTRAASSWTKASEIKAFPLPMACSLSEFPASRKCYFTIQSRDIYGRYGPFCDIQAISSL